MMRVLLSFCLCGLLMFCHANEIEQFKKDMKQMNMVYTKLKTTINVQLTTVGKDKRVYNEKYSITMNGDKHLYFKNINQEFIYHQGKTLLFSQPLQLLKFDTVEQINPMEMLKLMDTIMLLYSAVHISANSTQQRTYTLVPQFGEFAKIEITLNPQTHQLLGVKFIGNADSEISSSQVIYTYQNYTGIPGFDKFLIFDTKRGWKPRPEYSKYTFSNNLYRN